MPKYPVRFLVTIIHLLRLRVRYMVRSWPKLRCSNAVVHNRRITSFLCHANQDISFMATAFSVARWRSNPSLKDIGNISVDQMFRELICTLGKSYRPGDLETRILGGSNSRVS